MTTPAISVIIPAFCAAAYVGEALGSVFRQTRADVEVLLVNDGSPDVDDLERAIQPYRDRIIYIAQANRGPGAARNAAISRARGEFLAFLDSDDEWLPRYLEEQVSALQRDPGLDLIYADALLFGDSALSGRTYMETSPSSGPVTLESLLSRACMVITTCVVVRRQAVLHVGGFDEDIGLAPCEDLDLWIRLAYAGCRMAYQRKVLAKRRIHPASASWLSTRMWTAQMRVLNKAETMLALAPSLRAIAAQSIQACEAAQALEDGKRNFEEGRFAQAIDALDRANAILRSRRLRALALGIRYAPRLLRIAYTIRRRMLRTARRFNPVRRQVAHADGPALAVGRSTRDVRYD